jgi:ribosomal protein S18 acetylase RimI-like enzyme
MDDVGIALPCNLLNFRRSPYKTLDGSLQKRGTASSHIMKLPWRLSTWTHTLWLCWCVACSPMMAKGFLWGSSSTKGGSASKESPLLLPKKIIIRSSIESDLPLVADMLATASIQLSHSQKTNARPRIGFMAKLDQLWVRNDIEKLLSIRHKAIKEAKLQITQYESRSLTGTSLAAAAVESNDAVASSASRLSVLWKSDSFRKLVYRASSETGEKNLWRNHNYQLPPESESWLQHLQMTAWDWETDQVVAFCEIAMLANPTQATGSSTLLAQNKASNSLSQSRATRSNFSPAILNLCVDERHRRLGIAKRMLQRAERYVRQHWQAESLGLYVHAHNHAARALYKNLGYHEPEATRDKITVTCIDYDDASLGTLGDGMVYMHKKLTSTKSEAKLKRRGSLAESIL